MKIIVLGVGNPILGDDGVGIHVLNNLKKIVKNHTDVVFDEAITGGMNLLDEIIGYDKAIIIDAVNVKDANVGDVKRFLVKDFSSVHSNNPHDVSLTEAIKLAERLGETNIPKEIVVIGIVLHKNPVEFSEKLSNEIASAIPKATEFVLSELNKD